MRKNSEVVSIRVSEEIKSELDALKKKSFNVGDLCRKAIEEMLKKLKKIS